MHLEFRNYCISKVNFLIEITLCITAILSIELNADVKLPKGLGPLAIESSYSVVKGASIDINLMASSKQSGKVYEYTIFEKPKYGTLLTENNKIVEEGSVLGVGKIIKIKYIADFKNDIKEDVFTFRARLRGGKYSSPSPIKIFIIKEPINFSVIDYISFGNLRVNESSSKELIITNESNEGVNVELSGLKKFYIEGNLNTIVIPAKSKKAIKISYKASLFTGLLKEDLILKAGKMTKYVKLRGNVLPPFDIDKKFIKLKNDQLFRKSKVILKNNYSEPIEITAIHSNHSNLIYKDKTTLDSNGQIDFEIKVHEQYLGKIDSPITFRYGEYSISVDVNGEPLPAKIKINDNVQTVSVRGKVGDNLNATIPIINIGGEAVDLEFKLTDSKVLKNYPSNLIRLIPGSKHQLELSYQANVAGTKYDNVQFTWPSGDASLQIKYQIDPEKESTQSKNFGNRNIEKVQNKILETDILPVIEKERNTNVDLSIVENLSLVNSGKKSILISWTNDSSPEVDYIVETKVHRLNRENKTMQFHWVELDDNYATITKNDSGGEAVITGLNPGGRYTFRVLAKGSDGSFSVPSESAQFLTKNKFNLTRSFFVNGLGLLGGLFLLFYFSFKFFRERFV